MPGASRPDGVIARVSRAPSSAASAFILRTALGTPPSLRASACATSLPDAISRACMSCSTVYSPPLRRPMQEHSWSRSSWVATTVVSSGSSLATTMASSTFITDAGRCLPCGSNEASTAPLSMSASTQLAAVRSSGSGLAFGGSTRPHSARRSPPTGVSGTGSGLGGFVPSGTCSDVSTGGGGLSRLSHGDACVRADCAVPVGAASAAVAISVHAVRTRAMTGRRTVEGTRPGYPPRSSDAHPPRRILLG